MNARPQHSTLSTLTRLEHLAQLPRPKDVLPALLRGGLVGLFCGILVGVFRWSHLRLDGLTPLFGQEHAALWWLFLLGTGAVVSLFMDRLPQIRSSGIPVVEDAEEKDAFFPWRVILWGKFVATWLVLVGGLSVGREGPCIEMGAAVGMGVSTVTKEAPMDTAVTMGGSTVTKEAPMGAAVTMGGSTVTKEAPMGTHPRGNVCLMAGAAAGLSAAFGAPIGGVAFVIEEMRCHTTPLMLGTILVAAFTADAVLLVFGIGPMFAYGGAFSLSTLWLALPFGVALGLAGAAYNAVLLACTRFYTRLPFPHFTRALPPLLVAGWLLTAMPRLLGGGEILIDALPGQSDTLAVLTTLLLLKFLFSLLCAASSVPGGLLMPMLCLGGMMGAVALRSFTTTALPPDVQLWAVLGMVGFFAASVRAPVTGVALALEMTGAWHALPSALIIAFVAAKTADMLKSEPIYEALRAK